MAELKTEEQKVSDLLDAVDQPLTERSQRISWQFPGGDLFEREYTQKPMSAIPKIYFMKTLTKALKEAVGTAEGESMTISDVLGLRDFDTGDLTGADAIVQILFRVADLAPDLVIEVLMVAWNVPRSERKLVIEILEQPHDDETGHGGLSDDDLEDSLVVFGTQNSKALAGFFTERTRRIVSRVAAVFGAGQTEEPETIESVTNPASSRPTKRTPRATPKES